MNFHFFDALFVEQRLFQIKKLYLQTLPQALGGVGRGMWFS